MSKNYEKLLSDPFEEGDVEWRVQQSGIGKKSKPWVMVIPYITSRAVQQRLDDVFGVFGWENTYKPAPQSTVSAKDWVDGKKVTVDKIINNWLCGITIIDGDKRITKWDGAEETAIEPFKGGLSGAIKRAAVQFGIGRYLYNLETEFALCKLVDSRSEVSDNGNYIKIKLQKNQNSFVEAEWIPPKMPDWAMPSAKSDTLIENIKAATDLIVLRVAYQKAYKYANSFNRGDLLKKIIETKDIRKKSIEGDSQVEMLEEEKKIRKWLELTVTDEIFGASNESVLKLAKARISEELKCRAVDSEVDIMDMMKILENYYQKQMSKLNGVKP